MSTTHFIVKNTIVKVVCGRDMSNYLSRLLSSKVPNSFWMRKKKWDGKIRFFDKKNQAFSRGLWPHVKKHFEDNKIPYKRSFKVRRIAPPTVEKDFLKGITLEKDQLYAINRWFKSGSMGLIWYATGSGKTEIACAIMKQVLKHTSNTKILFLVNTKDLLTQATNRIKLRLGVNVGRVQSGIHYGNRRILVGTIQTVDTIIRNASQGKDIKLFKKLCDLGINMVVYDEVHHQRSEQSKRMIAALHPMARLGISARPFQKWNNNITKMNAGDVSVLSSMGPIVAKCGMSKLIKRGRLARPVVFCAPVGGDRKWESEKWHEARKQLLIKNPKVHRVVLDATKAATEAGETTLIVVGNSIDLGKDLHKLLKANKIKAENLTGKIDSAVRERTRKRLNKGKIDAIIATTIYDEGVDIPNIRQLVIAAGGKSSIKIEQRLGRGIRRKSSGTNRAIIIDVMVMNNKHLRNHSMDRLSQYQEESEFDIKVVNNDSVNIEKLFPDVEQVNKLPSSEYFKALANQEKSSD